MPYSKKRVLVIGGLGFIGLNMVKGLFEAGAEVTILSRTFPALALTWLDKMSQENKPTILIGDIALMDNLCDIFSRADIVFNFAGKSGAAKSLLEAHNDLHVNIEGNLNLLEAASKLVIKPKIVFISSRLVYGATSNDNVTEEYTPLPTSIYGLHKLTVEHYYRLYYLHYGIPYVIFRLTNPYGPYQLPTVSDYGIVNLFMHRALQGKAISIYGNGYQLRDYIFIDDVVEALMAAGINDNVNNEILNLGSGKSESFLNMANIIKDSVDGCELVHVPWPDDDKKVETGSFQCDISKSKKVLNWTPRTDLHTGIAQSLLIYKEILS